MHRVTEFNPILWAILAVEVAFWVALAVGLTTRYVLRMPRASRIILLCVPLLDLVLIALTAVDLAGGAEPDFVHALAVIYLGFTIGFGHATIAWADRWFAYRFAGAPRPPKPPKSGPEYVRRMWAEWRRVLVAWAIALPGLFGLGWVAGAGLPADWDAMWADPLWAMAARLTAIAAIWFAAGPVYAMLFRWEDEGEPAGASPQRQEA
ncbi:hypothetical protein [Agromyces neolithicus]